MPHSSRSSGFTLIEMLVAIAIGTILMTLAVPGFQALIANNRLSGQTNELMTALGMARSEAIRKGHLVTMCKSSDGSTCASSGDWTAGWIVFADEDGDQTLDVGEVVMDTHSGSSAGIVIKGSSGVASKISFRPDGRVSSDGTLRVCSDSSAIKDSNRARDITILATGRAVSSVAAGVTSACDAPT